MKESFMDSVLGFVWYSQNYQQNNSVENSVGTSVIIYVRRNSRSASWNSILYPVVDSVISEYE